MAGWSVLTRSPTISGAFVMFDTSLFHVEGSMIDGVKENVLDIYPSYITTSSEITFADSIISESKNDPAKSISP